MTKKLSVGLLFTSDKSMKKVNRKVFNKDHSTDVISIPHNESGETKDMLGDIVVNLDAVKQNASEYKVPFVQELSRVVTHGVLHLYGYDDTTDKGRSAMKSIEDAVVNEIEVDDILNTEETFFEPTE